jgi:NTP pyrophosphatase (non-canonical NTP hydrolase)
MRTIDEWNRQLLELYGERNARHLPSLEQRIIFLILGIRILRRAIRRKDPDSGVGEGLARVFARTVCVAQHFAVALPLGQAFERKYAHGCSYCSAEYCRCTQEARPEPRHYTNVSTKGEIQLPQLCLRLNKTYASKNHRLGIYWILDRLSDEVTELFAVGEQMRQGSVTPQQARELMVYELADVMAWTIAVANYYSIPLHEALNLRYGVLCWSCRQKPCDCPPYIFNPEKYQ